MALPDYIRYTPGTAIIWGEANGAGTYGTVTKTLSLDALADGSARMGAYADLGAAWDMDYMVMLIVETGTAPTAGLTADLFFACSHVSGFFPGAVTGADGAWPADGAEDEWAKQLELVLSLVATNDANTVQVQAPRIWRPSGRYVVPVVDTNLGQAFRDLATASENNSRVILVPLQATIADT